ncbi:MAG: FHA domain-containing protein [Pyrinomonadaceae bacterium]|nr:FHA domain-containing protein [Pyrinomonadaceae bacterium]
MLEAVLIIPAPEGSRELPLDPGRTTIGRADADVRLDDEGLSRLHASVYFENGNVWIVDENSSNGTFVNGAAVTGSGTPLANGDSIEIGNRTRVQVRITERAVQPAAAPAIPVASQAVVESGPGERISILPIALIALALFITSISAVLIGYKVFAGSGTRPAVSDSDPDIKDIEPERTPKSQSTAKTKDIAADTVPSSGGNSTTSSSNDLPIETKAPPPPPATKPYLQLSESEKRDYIRDRAVRIAQVIGNRNSEAIPDAAVDKIKAFTDAYAKRINVKPLGGCRFGDNLQSTYERASKNAPFIVKAFNEKGIDPRIGIYLAMIESEHCVCLQSPTGPLGMFQFTKATGELHGLKTVSGASPNNPDERCEPEPSARAAASYMKALTARYGTGPSSVPLAIGSYNSGEGGLSSNLVKALESGDALPRDFWTLISKGDLLSKQFQSENFKYVPKFFAAAIVGENPSDFGMKLMPMSSYSK